MRTEDKKTFYGLNTLKALALTIYLEAEGESWDGKLGVGFVIMNRSRLWKKDIKDVCFEKNAFSCYLSTNPRYKTALKYASVVCPCDKIYDKCVEAANVCMNGWQESIVGDATYFRVPGTENPWFDRQVAKGKLVKVCEIGNHEYFKEAI